MPWLIPQGLWAACPPPWSSGLPRHSQIDLLLWVVQKCVISQAITTAQTRPQGRDGSCAVLGFVAEACPTLCDPEDRSLPGSSVHGDSPARIPGVGCHALLQGIFPTQGSNPGLLPCKRILYLLSHQGSPTDLISFNSHSSPTLWGN